jgi:hypothetical protein
MHDEPPTRRRLQAFSGAKSVGRLSQRDEELWYAMTSEDYNPRMESTLSFLTLLKLTLMTARKINFHLSKDSG